MYRNLKDMWDNGRTNEKMLKSKEEDYKRLEKDLKRIKSEAADLGGYIVNRNLIAGWTNLLKFRNLWMNVLKVGTLITNIKKRNSSKKRKTRNNV